MRPLTREELDSNFATAVTETKLEWYDAQDFVIEGRGWNNCDLPNPYSRLPAKAEKIVRREVWELGKHTSGLVVPFSTNAKEISVRWTVTNPNLAMNHMPATGVSGIDLYVKHEYGWRWLGVARPVSSPSNTILVASCIPDSGSRLREYLLYLPLYNGVVNLAIGIPSGSVIKKTDIKNRKRVVFYGSSITQGGCASRPGMSYTSILARALDFNAINLGFSGNGIAEPEMRSLVAEVEADVFVLDPLPNLQPSQVGERIPDFIDRIRSENPAVPIVLVESIIPCHNHLNDGNRTNHISRNEELEQLTRTLVANNNYIHYVKGDSLLGYDDEATVDGIHPTDLGFYRMAEAIMPVLKKVLDTVA